MIYLTVRNTNAILESIYSNISMEVLKGYKRLLILQFWKVADSSQLQPPGTHLNLPVNPRVPS